MNDHLDRARLLLERHRPAQAEPWLRRQLTLEPHDAQAHALLALCLVRLERFREALAEAQQAIHLAPDSPFAHFVQAVVLHDDEQWASRDRLTLTPHTQRNVRARLELAQRCVEEAIRLNPDLAAGYYLRASIQSQLERREEALLSIEQALASEPGDTGYQVFRVELLRQMGRGAEAAAAARDALSGDPEHTDVHAAQGWLLLQRGRPQEASHHFREALRLNPLSDSARRGALLAASAQGIAARELTLLTLWFDALTPRGRGWLATSIVGLVVALCSAAKLFPRLPLAVWLVAGAALLVGGMAWVRCRQLAQ
jgi:tetratricopeptide (TPR) repeat protein